MELSQAITRKSASNLALAFVLLPKPKRDGMAALYAFCREVADIADDESRPIALRRAQLAVFNQIMAAFVVLCERKKISIRYLAMSDQGQARKRRSVDCVNRISPKMMTGQCGYLFKNCECVAWAHGIGDNFWIR